MNPEKQDNQTPYTETGFPQPETPAASDALDQSAEAKSKPEKKKLSFWRRAFRALLLALIFFGLGAIAVIYGLYLPYIQTSNQNTSDLQAAEQKISELEVQTKGMQPLEQQNQNLVDQLDQANIHVTLLSAKADIASAQLALAEKDANKTRVLLNKIAKTLTALSQQLPEEQRPLVKGMQDRLTLALNELEKQPFAASSDLAVLMASVQDLENILFQ